MKSPKSGIAKTPFSKTWFSENDLGPKPGGLKPVNGGRGALLIAENGQLTNRLGLKEVLAIPEWQVFSVAGI